MLARFKMAGGIHDDPSAGSILDTPYLPSGDLFRRPNLHLEHPATGEGCWSTGQGRWLTLLILEITLRQKICWVKTWPLPVVINDLRVPVPFIGRACEDRLHG